MIKFAPKEGKSVILKESDNSWYKLDIIKNNIPIKRKRAIIRKQKDKYRENINYIKIKKKRRKFFYILLLLLLLLFLNYRCQL